METGDTNNNLLWIIISASAAGAIAITAGATLFGHPQALKKTPGFDRAGVR